MGVSLLPPASTVLVLPLHHKPSWPGGPRKVHGKKDQRAPWASLVVWRCSACEEDSIWWEGTYEASTCGLSWEFTAAAACYTR